MTFVSGLGYFAYFVCKLTSDGENTRKLTKLFIYMSLRADGTKLFYVLEKNNKHWEANS